MKPPHIKAQREKEFRRIRQREKDLYAAQIALGYIELEKPVRHGWFKVVELTPLLERYRHSNAIIEVFKKIKTCYWGATKVKAQRFWDQERSRYMLTKDKPTISRKSYHKLSKQGKDLCVFFRYKDEDTGKHKGRFYVNFPPGCIQIRYRRAYITHRKRIDPLIEQELAELSSRLMTAGFYELMCVGNWSLSPNKQKSFENKVEAHRVKERLSQFRNSVISEDLKEKILWE